ncbi:hypothetical protein HLB23_05515 [Nocardia uniformis]|uniref:Uncharacterized protein n=1 Tax=Nocardia uniformis TaxID=53432 RepID=A0A849BT65_9NOCA|nr:hypothetical protein [Nocardia uniformis]NNH69334.1 hypothetical protein [Nocardia uniformis]
MTETIEPVSRSGHRRFRITAAFLGLAAAATLTVGTAAAGPGGRTDDGTSGYILQFGENGYEHHWVENPSEPGYYYHDGDLHWNPGR